jgi:hypothetical protein
MECDDSKSGMDHTGACLEDAIGGPAYPERGDGALERPALTHETDDRDPVDLFVFATR